MNIAILLTTFNRKESTLKCLKSLYNARLPNFWNFQIYITDDNSTDGTVDALLWQYPNINIEISNNNLYWARGMNTSWKRALSDFKYDAFLLLNDDVILFENFWFNIKSTHEYCLKHNKIGGIYVSSTLDPFKNRISYGGSILKKSFLRIKTEIVIPTNSPISCQLTNANILLVNSNVVNKIDILDENYIHGIADYDYSLNAISKNFNVYVTPNYGGYCINDHGNNWLNSSYSLKERVKYLYSPKGLAYNEYMYYLLKHFPFYAPIGFALLWLKTFFPFLWTKFKC
jgi:GT2 family glycosyltransferase